MAEELNLNRDAARADIYRQILPQLKSLTEAESDLVANLANIAAVLKEAFGFFWVGFYLVKGEELVLGPFQGTLACTRIKKGKGVCGSAWERKESLIVPDVEKFPGHIACSSLSKSEIVVPVIKNGSVVMVLDVDSDQLNAFDSDDQQGLEYIASLISGFV